VAPNVLDRRFDGWRQNQAWVSDIRLVMTGEGWAYVAAILNLEGRSIVGCSMSERIRAERACQALRSACWQRKPALGPLLHSDSGSQMRAAHTVNWPPTLHDELFDEPTRQRMGNAPIETNLAS
jgi:transposase InsO family protein